MCRTVIGRSQNLVSYANAEPFIYAMAESLFAINLYIQSEHATADAMATPVSR